MKTKMRTVGQVLFLIVVVCAIFEYLFVFGMFTAPLMFLLLLLTGIGNVVLSLVERKPVEGYLYALATIGFCLGYAKELFL